MREEDKVLLLCEIFNVDTTPYIEKYVEELRSSDIFMHLCKNVSEARKVNSYKAQLLIDEFESIDFGNIFSLKEVFVLTAKINYLVSISEAKDYINPFFHDPDNDEIEEVGLIVINFDEKSFTLDDMILDERYTSRYKINHIKHNYLEWRREVVDKVITPLKTLIIQEEKIPRVKLFNSYYVSIIVITIFLNLLFIFTPLFDFTYIRWLYSYQNPDTFIQNTYTVCYFLLMWLDAVLIINITHKINRNRKFLYSMRILKKGSKILRTIDKKCERFFQYVLNGINDNKLLKKKLKSFSMPYKDIASVAYLYRVVESYDKEKDVDQSFVPLVLHFSFVAEIIAFIIVVIGWMIVIGG